MPEYAIALGTFDGIHLGHQAVLQSILQKGCTPIALTFNTPPKMGKETNLIMNPEDKNRRLEGLGIKPVVMDFNEVKDMTPEEFLSFVQEKYRPKIIATGYNFRFGKGASGDTSILRKFCNANGIKYVCTDSVLKDGKPVSSTAIREFISGGEIKKANAMLSHYFSFFGRVEHGDERGRTIGFPTINVPYPDFLVKPKFGVYASVTEDQYSGEFFKSVTNIGIRPTFQTDFITSETNIIDFNKNIYEKKVRIYLVDFIREETKFGSLEGLKKAIAADKEMANFLLNDIKIQSFR